MKETKQKFSHESLQDAESIEAILKADPKGLAKGKVVLSDDQGEIELEPKGLLTLKVSASQDEDENSLSLRVKWRTKRDIPKKSKLTVTSK